MKTPEEIKEQIGILFNMLDMRDKMQIAVQLNVLATGHLLANVPKMGKYKGMESYGVNLKEDLDPISSETEGWFDIIRKECDDER